MKNGGYPFTGGGVWRGGRRIQSRVGLVGSFMVDIHEQVKVYGGRGIHYL
jgi:hypothetical protein